MPLDPITGQYTFGVPQQNNGYYSSGYGTPGATNPYEQGGSKYVGSMLPGNNGGAVGGLLAETNNIQRPGFDDASGKPIHMSPHNRADGTKEHTSSYYFNQAQKSGQSVNEWNNMSPHEKAQVHENAAKLAAEAGDKFAAYSSMDAAERLRTGTPFWANPEGGYQGLGPWNYGDEDEYVAPGEGDFYILPGDQRGPQWGELGEGFMKLIDPLSGLDRISGLLDSGKQYVNSVFNANEQAPAQVTTSVANAFNPYVGYEAAPAPAPAPANNEDGYGGYANQAAHAAAQSVMEEKTADGEYWYI